MRRRCLSVLLAAALLLTILPYGVFAADPETGDLNSGSEEIRCDENYEEMAPEEDTRQQADGQSAAAETADTYSDDDGYPNYHVNTGNQAFDACCAGLSQEGYTKSSNALVKYNYWYWGVSISYAWCGAFVSWCADQAGALGTAVQKNAIASGFNTGNMSSNYFGCPAYAFGSTAAKMGDIAYIGSGASNHVALVVGSSDSYIWCIEGNVSDSVALRRYAKSSGYAVYSGGTTGSTRILFYARPNYSGADIPYSIAMYDDGSYDLITPDGFIDVQEGDWYYEPVRWAYDNELAYGMTDYTFEPNRECTRSQIITFLWRMAGSPEPTYEDYSDYSYYSCFTDVSPESWYYQAVVWGVVNGYVYGITDKTFEPEWTCTRSQALTFLWRIAGSPIAESENIFEDVSEDAWYYDAVLWGSEQCIAYGMTETTYEPDTNCTRAQIVTFMSRVYEAYRETYPDLHD